MGAKAFKDDGSVGYLKSFLERLEEQAEAPEAKKTAVEYWQELVNSRLEKQIHQTIFGTFNSADETYERAWYRAANPPRHQHCSCDPVEVPRLKPDGGELLVDGQWIPNLVKYRTVEENGG